MSAAPEQLELFPTLPLLLRPPRRLRLLGFELEQIKRDIAVLTDCLRCLDRNETDLAEVVAEARTVGHVLPKAYRVVVKNEELRQISGDKLRDACDLYRGLECQLNKKIDNYLKRKPFLAEKWEAT